MRIWHFGFLANSVRARQLPCCREFLRTSHVELPASENDVLSAADPLATYAGIEPAEITGAPWPKCGQGYLVRRKLDADPRFDPFSLPPGIDSS